MNQNTEVSQVGVWVPASVSQEPSITLVRWQIIRVRANDIDTFHFVGDRKGSTHARVSSTMTAFDKSTRRGITHTGRVYELHGDPDWLSDDAMYVLLRWLALQGLTFNAVEDATIEVFPESVPRTES